MLERRLKELERENDHLQSEVDVLYMQVDEQSGMLERSFAEAADAAVEGFLLAGLEEDRKKLREAEEAKSAKVESLEERPSPGPGSGKKPPLGPSRLGMTGSTLSDASSGGHSSPNLQRRHEELVESMDALREERNKLSNEVATLRRELDERKGGGGDNETMLAKEVETLLARQAELATNLAQVRREKELLEGENDLLSAQHENTPIKTVAEHGTSPASFEPSSGSAMALRGKHESSPRRLSSPSFGEDAMSASSSSSNAQGRLLSEDNTEFTPHPRRGSVDESGESATPASAWRSAAHRVARKGLAPAPNTQTDGPDAELAAKLIGRLNRAGESDQAQLLSHQMDDLIHQREEMQRAMEKWQREKAEMEAEMERLKEIENISPKRSADDLASLHVAELDIAAKEAELERKTRALEETVSAQVAERLAAAEAKHAEAEMAYKEEAELRLKAMKERLAEAEARAVAADSSASHNGRSEKGWNELLAEKESELERMRLGEASKDQEIEALKARVRVLEADSGGIVSTKVEAVSTKVTSAVTA